MRIGYLYKMIRLLPLVWFLCLFCACAHTKEGPSLPDPESLEHALLESNKRLVERESESINLFIQRLGMEMEETGSGLRYVISREGEGEKAAFGQVAIIDYTVYLINGDVVYTSWDASPLSFTIGRGGVESGLEEGILLMRKGGNALFVLPSHLAHGLPGDGDKIPRRATIIYEVDLLSLY